jgi:hypothetical protein
MFEEFVVQKCLVLMYGENIKYVTFVNYRLVIHMYAIMLQFDVLTKD